MIKSIVLVVSAIAAFAPGQERTAALHSQTEVAQRWLQAAGAAANLRGVDRAYAYWLISQAWRQADPKQEERPLKKSCEAALAPGDDSENVMLRNQIQLDCVRRMLAIKPKVGAGLLARADPDVRQQILAAKAVKSAKKGDIDAALTMLSSEVSQGARYPYERALEVIKTLPEGDRPDKDRVFAQALFFYRQKHSRFDVGPEDMGTLVVRLWRDVSPGLVLEAIDELLDVAREESSADSHLQLTLKSGAEGATFGSLYEYRLFQLLPVLRDFDPGRAGDLIREDAQAGAALEKYTNGLQSFSDAYSTQSTDSNSFSMGFHMVSGPAGGNSGVSTLQLRSEAQAEKILARSKDDPEGALQDALGLADVFSPSRSLKADLLLRIARAAGKEHESVTTEALHEAVKSVEHIGPLTRCRYLVLIADEYFRVSDADKARGTLVEAIKAIRKLYAADTNSDDPNRSPKSAWPSTVVARACAALAARVSSKFAEEFIRDLPDPDLGVFARIELAGEALGMPSYPALIQERHKEKNSYRVAAFPIPSGEAGTGSQRP